MWYHGQWCKSRGQNCFNTRLTTEKGCCTWNDEQKFLADIEEHLGVTISQIGKNMQVEVDEFDGKVVYGKKRKQKGNFFITYFANHIFSLILYLINQALATLATLPSWRGSCKSCRVWRRRLSLSS